MDLDLYLETERMTLRRFTAADVEDLVALHGDPVVMARIDDGWPVPRAVVEARTLPGILEEYRELAEGFGCFGAYLRATGAFVGWFSLRAASSAGLSGGTEIGYRLLPSAWGCGYGTEGARAVVGKAFGELGVERVVATTMTVNVASRRVMEKAGLSLVRTFFEEWPEYIEGAEHGDVEYALTREDWSRAVSR
ncbi:MAG TPA: GNAT family N-acetyltransferase [Actinospica sp.]|jgi:RimJ/RimL family protein N-acetyltransferase|nr:GNAT family N-acetyltransferase [Actinospica sp.]